MTLTLKIIMRLDQLVFVFQTGHGESAFEERAYADAAEKRGHARITESVSVLYTATASSPAYLQ